MRTEPTPPTAGLSSLLQTPLLPPDQADERGSDEHLSSAYRGGQVVGGGAVQF